MDGGEEIQGDRGVFGNSMGEFYPVLLGLIGTRHMPDNFKPLTDHT